MTQQSELKQDFRYGYDLQRDILPITKGTITPPNFQEKTVAEVATLVASHHLYYLKGLIKLPHFPTKYVGWATYFLTQTQVGRFDGEGYVLYRDYAMKNTNSTTSSTVTKAGKFAICLHKKLRAPSAQPSLGWYPCYCTLCGLDMTVDSGD